MKKLLLFCLVLAVSGCKEAIPVPDITGLVGKIWKAQTVKEGDVTVYQDGSPSNIRPGYSKFRLDLRQPGKATLIDVDGRTTTADWVLSTDNSRLILENVTPAPSSTSGAVEFFIQAPPNGSTFTIRRTTDSRKTGNTINEYVLIPAQ